jgi:hypothetical protein
VNRLGKKTLYVRDGDEKLWEKAEAIVGEMQIESLSKLVTDALEKEVNRLEALRKVTKEGFERIVFEYRNELNGPWKKVAFNGKWLAENYSGNYQTEGIAMTEKGQFFYCRCDIQTDHGFYQVFESFDDLKGYANNEGNRVDTDLISEAAEEIGEDYVEFLNI